ncbi:MAG TPA: hypothetical protein VM261_26805 [Kofleriaceae bacterium]|nr:hypothetical protein [Kofleriaceae bacterium]
MPELAMDLRALGARQPEQLLTIEPPANRRHALQLPIDLAPVAPDITLATIATIAVAIISALRAHVGHGHRHDLAAATTAGSLALSLATPTPTPLFVEHLAAPPAQSLLARAPSLYTLHFRRSGLRSRRRFAPRSREIASRRLSFSSGQRARPRRRSERGPLIRVVCARKPRQSQSTTDRSRAYGSGVATASEILRILDSCCDAYTFPMLDNGYIYLAATRLSLFRSQRDWGLVMEVFGFSPRAEFPDLTVYTYAGELAARRSAFEFRGLEGHRQYLHNHPHDESRSLFDLEEGDWQDPDNCELVTEDAHGAIVLRGRTYPLPPRSAYARLGIELVDPRRLHTFELIRYLAAIARDEVLATPSERRANLAADQDELLVLDDWHHPDLAGDERPSQLESFQQLALVLETGDVSRYRPTAAGNTHWRNWPGGGSL